MDVLQAIRERRSIHVFKSDPVPETEVKTLIEAASWAPSTGNLQCRKFYLVRRAAAKEDLAAAALGQRFIAQAPLVLVVCADSLRADPYGERGRSLYALQDATASAMNILLAAHGMGLGACWVGAFDEARVVRILGLPDYERPVVIIPVGYPDETPETPPRVLDDGAVVEID